MNPQLVLYIEERAKRWAHRQLMREFVRGGHNRLKLREYQLRRAYGEGQADGRMVGRSAIQAASVLTSDGEAAVCYMNGVQDAVAGV